MKRTTRHILQNATHLSGSSLSEISFPCVHMFLAENFAYFDIATHHDRSFRHKKNIRFSRWSDWASWSMTLISMFNAKNFRQKNFYHFQILNNIARKVIKRGILFPICRHQLYWFDHICYLAREELGYL